jgi:hypothetical protein
MAYDPRSSFGQVPGVVPAYVEKQKTIQVYRVLAGIAVTLAVCASIAVFVYKLFSQNELNVAKEELKNVSAEDVGNQRKIAELQAYDLKLTTARKLLDDHLASSRLFEELERSTKATVVFTKFEYTYEPGSRVLLSLVGNTSELDSTLLQKRQFFRDGLFSEFVVRDVTLLDDAEDEEGEVVSSGVSFAVEGVFKKTAIAYQGDVVEPAPEGSIDITTSTSTEAVTASSTVPLSNGTSTVTVDNQETP